MPQLPTFEIKIGSKTYYRAPIAHGVTKASAQQKAKDLRKQGYLARVIKNPTGGWTTYYASNPRSVEKFRKSLPEEIRHLVPRG